MFPVAPALSWLVGIPHFRSVTDSYSVVVDMTFSTMSSGVIENHMSLVIPLVVNFL